MTPDVLLLCFGASLVLGAMLGPRCPRLWLAVTIAGTAASLMAAGSVLIGGPAWEWRSDFVVAGEPMHLRLDAISAWFLALLSVLGSAGAIYSREYWSDRDYPESAPRGRFWWSAMILAMSLVLLSSNGLHFLIAWELFAVSSYFLITLDRGQREVRRAGWLYLAASHAGTLCLFAFFTGLAARTGSWELGPMRDKSALAPFFWLALFGFGVKGGLFPLHIWLPSAHANAPSHVSALMSGVAIKMGVYGLIRFSGWLPLPSNAGWVIIGIGAITALFGIAFALAQNDLKRLLAYCSVENIGIILIGLGGTILAATHGESPWGRLALAGALLHIWNHGLFKALLFFGAGSVLHATGTREMSRLGGLWKNMPWTAGLFALGAAAISGLPPLNGFVSEWLVYLGLFDATANRSLIAWAAIPAIIMLAMTGALALATFLKAGAVVFLGAPRTKPATHAHECGPLMRGPMLALGIACIIIGLAPVCLWPILSRVIEVWQPAWTATETPESLAKLGSIHLALTSIGCLAALWLWQSVQNKSRRALTWDCGYSAPAARMQYTSGSFGGIAAGWFFWLLRPERRVRRPRGPLPIEAFRLEYVPETVLERVIEPAGGFIMRISNAARRLQHGRLQFYIVYLLAGLTTLGVIVYLGGNR